jgi:hypothetical protein
MQKSGKYKYVINNQCYIVPNIGFQAKLWYFDFACIPGVVNNSKVESDWCKERCNISPQQNRYYDIHYFFNTLVRKGFFPDFFDGTEENGKTVHYVPDEVKDFVKRIVPEKYRSGKYVYEKGRININDEFLTADEILKTDVFFKIMREKSKESDLARVEKFISEIVIEPESDGLRFNVFNFNVLSVSVVSSFSLS